MVDFVPKEFVAFVQFQLSVFGFPKVQRQGENDCIENESTIRTKICCQESLYTFLTF